MHVGNNKFPNLISVDLKKKQGNEIIANAKTLIIMDEASNQSEHYAIEHEFNQQHNHF